MGPHFRGCKLTKSSFYYFKIGERDRFGDVVLGGVMVIASMMIEDREEVVVVDTKEVVEITDVVEAVVVEGDTVMMVSVRKVVIDHVMGEKMKIVRKKKKIMVF